MNTDVKLERYLHNLELALRSFPVTDRSEIIIEIRSHILTALEKEPQAKIDTVLDALGAPETVANKYLLERGLKTAKPPISPIVKWLVIGFLGSVALLTIGTIALFSYLSPVVKVDEKTESVSLFNGAIQVDGKKLNKHSGSAGVARGQLVEVRFKTGNYEVKTSDSSNFVWSCRGLKTEGIHPETIGESLVLDLSNQEDSNCEISLPSDSRLKIVGRDGNLEVDEPRFSVEAELENGNLSFEQDEASQYKFEIKIENGRAATFTSSEDLNAYLMKFTVRNGNIEN